MFDLHQIRKKYKVPSQTGWKCKNGLEIIENILVNYKNGTKYNYCETGSYLGGTLFPRLNSQHCSECLSIDKRVNIQLDERQEEGYSYKGIKTSEMIDNLKNHLDEEKLDKLESFDGSIQEYKKNRSNFLGDKKYDWIFIDAEHTNIASFDDFLTSMSLIDKNCVIALHDNWMIFSAISNICSFLDYLQINYRFVHIDGAISAFFFGDIADFSKKFDKYFITTDKNLFIKKSRSKLWKFQNYQILRKPKSIFKSLKIIFGNYLKRINIKLFDIKKGRYSKYLKHLKNLEKKKEIERRIVSYKSHFFNSGFSFSYAKNEKSQLNKLCDLYGTDKGESRKVNHPYEWKSHNYADLYEMLFRCRRKNVQLLIECGLGTNNINLKSSMGINGKPGASLRMWRDFFPKARIIGVDIDKEILFNEERIETFYCDQLNKKSIENFSKQSNLLENSADIILDDGLHTFKAGISFFEGMIKFLNEDGIYVIEDINPNDMFLYKDYFSKLTNEFTVHFIKGNRPNDLDFGNNRLLVIFKNNVQ